MVSTAGVGALAAACALSTGVLTGALPVTGAFSASPLIIDDGESGRIMLPGVSSAALVKSGTSGGVGAGPMEAPAAPSMPGTVNEPIRPAVRTAASVAPCTAECSFSVALDAGLAEPDDAD